jgi:hypothetical protein
MDRVLTWFIRGWVTLAVFLNIAAIIGLFIGAGSFWGGMSRVWDIYGPFNIINWASEIALLSPAIAADIWLKHRRQKRATDTPAS